MTTDPIAVARRLRSEIIEAKIRVRQLVERQAHELQRLRALRDALEREVARARSLRRSSQSR
jgi:hypothetical protein